nr:F0F1 ATP synthase subunit gamma [Candidatus Omnitrophota bacterium]
MQTLRQIKGRIRSIANTRKITSAMQMVSAAKLSRSRTAFHSYRVYIDRLESLLKNFSAGMTVASHPFLEKREGASSATLCVIASDSGLCGTYNNNILTAAKKFLDSNKDREIDVIAVGHEVSKFMKKRNIRVT